MPILKINSSLKDAARGRRCLSRRISAHRSLGFRFQPWGYPKSSKHGHDSIWVCLKMGYTPNYSHLVGIMISKTIGCRGTLFSDKPIWFNIETHGDLGKPEETIRNPPIPKYSQSLFQNEANHSGEIHVLSDSAKFHLQGISRIAAEQAIVSWEAANHWGLQISHSQNWGTKGPTLFLMVFEVLNHSQSVSRILSHGHIDQASQAHIPLVSHMFRTRLESGVGWKMWCGRHTCLRFNPPVTVLMRQRSVGIESILDFCGKIVDLLRIGSKVWKPGWLKHHRTSWSRFSLIWAVRLPYLTAWANTPQQETESHKFTPRPRQTWAPGCNRGVMDKRLTQRRNAGKMMEQCGPTMSNPSTAWFWRFSSRAGPSCLSHEAVQNLTPRQHQYVKYENPTLYFLAIYHVTYLYIYICLCNFSIILHNSILSLYYLYNYIVCIYIHNYTYINDSMI